MWVISPPAVGGSNVHGPVIGGDVSTGVSVVGVVGVLAAVVVGRGATVVGAAVVSAGGCVATVTGSRSDDDDGESAVDPP